LAGKVALRVNGCVCAILWFAQLRYALPDLTFTPLGDLIRQTMILGAVEHAIDPNVRF
jgi:hypothetical protein